MYNIYIEHLDLIKLAFTLAWLQCWVNSRVKQSLGRKTITRMSVCMLYISLWVCTRYLVLLLWFDEEDGTATTVGVATSGVFKGLITV